MSNLDEDPIFETVGKVVSSSDGVVSYSDEAPAAEKAPEQLHNRLVARPSSGSD